MLLKRAKEFLCLLILLVALCSSTFLPTSLESQGNKKREPPKIQIDRSGTGYFYSSGCEQRVKNWSGWSGGLNGKILVKDAGDPALKTWTVVIQLDKSVKKLQSYDSKTEKVDDRTYKISPLSWNAEIKQEAVKTVSLQVWWPQGEAEPKIRHV